MTRSTPGKRKRAEPGPIAGSESWTCPHCGAQMKQAAAAERHVAMAHEPLSRAQLRVLRLLNRGLTTREIATSLNVAVGTVRWHFSHIFAKLNARNRTEAIVKARQMGVL